MKKIIAFLLTITSGISHAIDVDFGFFDSPSAQADKFERAFTPNQAIESININGHKISLPRGNWRVVGASSNQSHIKQMGDGVDIPITDGTLVLAGVENGD